MTTWNGTALRATLLTCSLVGALGCNSAFAGEQKPGPKPHGSGAPSASAMPPEAPAKLVDGHKPWAPTRDVVLPDVASDAPTKEEWLKAPAALDVRVMDPGCEAHRIREWYRFTCGLGLVEMISGAREGVTFTCTKTQPDTEFCSEAGVVFPVRRGDRRAFQFLGWSRWGPEPDSFLTEQYLEGDTSPSISLQGLRWDF